MTKLCSSDVFKEHVKSCRCGAHRLSCVNPVKANVVGGTHH